ncbi:helicase-exonuclease AddAB subunit AddA [Limosilactobacillus sp.]|jgi:ATP-dependent helicase/nuclease subunit A|uniref:helicase-exonuclease AddAB subunit AddA n=1 Tax=Limosilactobacillus sp. TaxID=2773925 RepID=UPI0025B8C486|nr:helicase-exonuclease AddAB subunit AddA [Limosilactobacillus sp.]MCH3921751.1 helicase-exonuclease AddAB subunit AddA [Limosilactobacillus sp.]MCH3928522.1 helicase-exonuclease AddAB subunit AddA [Limosilactobacillus sp.]
MATFKPTAAQARAIDDRGKNILVSASAGSGKTAVLVNRVIKLLKEGQSIDRMLLVTFTDAAAKNMRDKIRQALQKIAQDPSQPKALRDRMVKQLNLLAAADISTIHAFCLRLIKRYYYLIDLDPQFRLLTDDTERLLLEEEVWQEVSERFYADADAVSDDTASFRQLVLNFSSDRDDQGLDDLVLRLYDVANAQAQPEEWLAKLPESYDLGDSALLESKFYQQQLKPVLVEHLQQFQRDDDEAIRRARDTGLDKDATTLGLDRAAFQQLIDSLNGERAGNVAVALQQVQFGAFRGKPKDDADQLAVYNELKDQRTALKKEWTSLVKDYLGEPLAADQLVDRVSEIQTRFGELTARAEEAGLSTTQQTLTTDQRQLQLVLNLFEPITWNSLRLAFQNLRFETMPRLPKAAADSKQDHAAIKASRDTVKKQFAKLTEQFFAYDEQQLRDISGHAQALLKKLSLVTRDFLHQYQQIKLNRHVLEFSDLEHYAYQILTPAKDDADWQALVQSLQQHYQAIMIDEYQDTNQLQESILMHLARPGAHNLFMVGDVKQSIYRFREADPSLFLGKYRRYRQSAGDEAIVLGENFRSMKNVTDFTNLLFGQLMDPEVGEIAYDQDAELKYAAHYYDDPQNAAQPVEVLLYDANATSQKKQAKSQPEDQSAVHEDDKLVGEFRMVGAKIQQLVEGHQQIYDPDHQRMRDIQYGDIVLLERTKNNNNTLMEEFSKLGIPLTVHDVESYFQATEVRVMLSLLKIIDNPHQDIPLVAVLRSPIVGLNNQELAFIRLQNRAADYYTALRTFMATYAAHHKMRPYKKADQLLAPADQKKLYQKMTRFLHQLEEFRQTSRQQTLVDLIWQVYEETGYLDYVGAMRGGQQRQANLHALYQRAHDYEQTSFKGLYQFIRFIEKMQEHDKDLGVAPTQLTANTVNVMTIHGSKGLQFPIVFLIDATHGFNNGIKRVNAVVDAKAGMGIRWMDADRVVYDTPQRQVALDTIERSERAEDLRVLYVALTRAEQRLYITGSFNEELKNKSLTSSWQRWQKAFQSNGQVLSPQPRIGAQSFMDWIGLALTRYANPTNGFTAKQISTGATELDDSSLAGSGRVAPTTAQFRVHSFAATDLEKLRHATQPANESAPTPAPSASDQPQSSEHPLDITATLTYQYPHQAATVTTAYQSVTDVKRVFEDDDPRLGQPDYSTPAVDEQGTNKARRRQTGIYINPDFAVPDFIQQDTTKPRATQVGTATHLVFQKLPLTGGVVTAADVQAEIDRLTKAGLITPAVADQIDREGIVGFFGTAVGKQILDHPENYHREEPFAMIMNGHEPFSEIAAEDDDTVLIHGIIDGYLVTDQGIILVDYKTDHVAAPEEKNKKKIIQKYSGQLKLYAEALNIMQPRPVVQMGLYLLELNEFISIQGRGENRGDH